MVQFSDVGQQGGAAFDILKERGGLVGSYPIMTSY